MKIVDAHCDVLLKLWEDERRSFQNDEEIQANYERLKEGNVQIQCFALFAEPYLKNDEKFRAILKQVQLFHEKVLQAPNVKHIRKWEDVFSLEPHEIGAILTLEGMDAAGDDLDRLKMLLELGVLSVGITWNEANLCADGVLEERGAGLTKLGKEAVSLLNSRRIFTDVSHLSERGFWDCVENSDYIWASHSNAKAICSHPRNLTDEQIRALIKKDGLIGVVFYPPFLTEENEADTTHVLRHIDHICSLGGKNHLCFGSDFDGIPATVKNFRHSGEYPAFVEVLLKYYSESDVRGFCSENFYRMIRKHFIWKQLDIE